MSACSTYTRRLVGKVLDWVVPPTCLGCDAVGFHFFCPDCARTLPPPLGPRTIDEVPLLSAYPYGSPVAVAVQRLKYQGRPELAVPLGRLLATRLGAEHHPRVQLIVPVPLHPRRLAERGYNQSGLLGRELGRQLGVRSETRALVRTRDTLQQAGLHPEARRENVRGSFAVRQPELVREQRVLVVDDVVTTGSTASACADALRMAGASVVGIASVCAVVVPA
jgi:ComF family protein